MRRTINGRDTCRTIIDWAATIVATLCAVLAIAPLVFIFGYLLLHGVTSIDINFFTQLPKPVGEPGGGMANAIVGTMILIGLACTLGLPMGILAGVYLAEFGNTRFGWTVRFAAEVLNGVPSIVIGIFAYTLIVLPMKSFSAYAGGFALGIMMIPVVTRTTEEIIRLVPHSLREASLALGVPVWRTTLKVIMRTARAGIVTGAMLAIARIAGETAPLLFTAFGNRFWHQNLDQPIASLTVQIYTYAISPFDDWHRQAWAGAVVLLGLVLLSSVAIRLMIRGRFMGVR